MPRRFAPRNDKLFSFAFALILLRKVSKTTVIANQSADWCGNPFPSLRSNVSAQRADWGSVLTSKRHPLRAAVRRPTSPKGGGKGAAAPAQPYAKKPPQSGRFFCMSGFRMPWPRLPAAGGCAGTGGRHFRTDRSRCTHGPYAQWPRKRPCPEQQRLPSGTWNH